MPLLRPDRRRYAEPQPRTGPAQDPERQWRRQGQRRTPDQARPGFRRIAPSPPFWPEDEALAEWNRVVPELTRLDVIKAEDAATLVTYCELWADFVGATATLKRDGYFIGAQQGQLKHPAVGIKHQAGRELRAVAAHFGLTPSTEQALARGGDDDTGDNPFDSRPKNPARSGNPAVRASAEPPDPIRDLKMSPEVLHAYIVEWGIPLPDCPPLIKTPEPRDVAGAAFDFERVDKVLASFKALTHVSGRWAGSRSRRPVANRLHHPPVFGWVRQDDEAGGLRPHHPRPLSGRAPQEREVHDQR